MSNEKAKFFFPAYSHYENKKKHMGNAKLVITHSSLRSRTEGSTRALREEILGEKN